MNKKLQSKYWKNKNINQIKSYWTSGKAAIRSRWFVEQLKQFDFDSIFEIGMFSGRNLKYIKDYFSEVKIGGLDINEAAVTFAKNKLPEAELICSDIYDINTLVFKYDIIYTSGTLIHIVPEDISDIIKKIIPHANKYIMHIEEVGHSDLVAGPKSLNPLKKESDQYQWNVDIISVYKDLGYDPKMINLPDDCRTNGASELIIVRL